MHGSGVQAVRPSGASASHAQRAAGPYERHRPEETLLYKTLQAHWTTFLRDLEDASEPPALPGFVVAEVEAFLRCGILGHGFVLGEVSRLRLGPRRRVLVSPPRLLRELHRAKNERL